jgi:acyl-CoA synthetase (AMP-forming)/AMP-acid ligase II
MLTAPTLPDLLRAAARQAPDAEAFRYRNERLTYRDWDTLADRMAAALAARGIRRGEVVALLLPSTPFYQVAYLAAARLGAVTAGINARYRRTEIGHILRRSGATLLIAVDTWHDADFRAAVEAQRDEFPELREVLWIPADDLRHSTTQIVTRLSAGAAPVSTATVEPDDPVAIIFTSGTTGVPKGAWYTHRSVLAVAEIDARRYAGEPPPLQKHLAAGLSFAHIGTMARIGLQIAFLGTTIIHDAFDPAATLAVIERERLEHLGGFPTQIIMLLDHPERPRRDLTSLKSIVLGGAPSSPELIRRIQRELGVVVSIRYSSTEVGIATASLADDPPEILTTTVGKPTAGVELRIGPAVGGPAVGGPAVGVSLADPLPVGSLNTARSDVLLDAGEVGEVLVRSPATMRGYWRDPEATAKTIDAAGWVHTGDMGCLDAAGYLHLRGRQSEMFIRGGYNIYPGEIEDLLARHPQVARVAVVGVPDPVFGEVGWAFVVPRGPQAPTLAELRAFVGAELASFKRPDGLSILPELPVTPMFKVDKRALRELGRG